MGAPLHLVVMEDDHDLVYVKGSPMTFRNPGLVAMGCDGTSIGIGWHSYMVLIMDIEWDSNGILMGYWTINGKS